MRKIRVKRVWGPLSTFSIALGVVGAGTVQVQMLYFLLSVCSQPGVWTKKWVEDMHYAKNKPNVT